ncbi:MAG: hypothetical protein V8T87_10985 [Victivallales bacterium]
MAMTNLAVKTAVAQGSEFLIQFSFQKTVLFKNLERGRHFRKRKSRIRPMKLRSDILRTTF